MWVEEVVILTMVGAVAVEVKDAVVEEEEDGLVDAEEAVGIKRDSKHMDEATINTYIYIDVSS